MGESLVLCLAISDGGDCNAEATLTTPVPLCDEHQMEIVMLVGTNLFAAALRQAKTNMVPVTLPPDERAAVIAGARPREIGPYFGSAHGPIVYFAENGERIKIGHSTNLRPRIRALSLQEKDVVLVLQGGLTLERALHATFAKERIDSTEWFVKSPRLMAFIKGKLADLKKPLRPAVLPLRPVISPAPKKPQLKSARPSLDTWAALAAPLSRAFTERNGTQPTASVLAGLLRSARPDLQVPGSDRWERNLRLATEMLLDQGGQV